MQSTPSLPPRRTPALIAVLGSATFIVLLIIAHVVQPGVDPSWQPPSELAIGPGGWAMTAAFVALGVGCSGLFFALANQPTTWPGRIGRWATGLGALSGFVAAAFPADPTTTPSDEVTLVGAIHSVAPVLLDGIPVAAILLAISLPRRSPRWRPMRTILFVGAVLTVAAALVLTVSLGLLLPESGRLGPDVPIGWQGRSLLFVDALWVVVVGGGALRLARSAPVGDAQASARSLDREVQR